MKRKYDDNQVHSDTVFFTGYEVENTPAKGKFTLFVVGTQLIEDITCYCCGKVQHIYFGANQSFTADNIQEWENMIKHFLNLNYWCTLDFNVQDIEDIHESGLCEYRRFIPQISVKIPYLQLLNYNATIKIDDKDFEGSNSGVWCIPVQDLTAKKYFTDWDEYTKDTILPYDK